MAWIRRLVALAAVVCAVAGAAFAADVEWTDFDLKVVDDLVNECAKSDKVKAFTEEHGRTPLVVTGEISNNTGEEINTALFVNRLEDALINSKGVFDFVAGADERQALRAEKRDQDFHANVESAKAIDRETAADFMMAGDLNLLKATSKKLSCQLVIKLYDIESNRVVFSRVQDFTIKGEKVKHTKTAKERRGTVSSPQKSSSGADWDTYKIVSLTIPVVRRSFDGDGGDADCEFHATMVGFDKSTFRVHYPSHITLMTKYGIAAGFGGTMSADYGRGDEVELEEIIDLTTYWRVGAGYAFYFGATTFIPTAGVGVSLDYLGATDDTTAKHYSGYDATVDGFVNLTALVTLSDMWGLSLSCELSMNLCGAGSFTELETYGINFDLVSFMPAIGVCCWLW